MSRGRSRRETRLRRRGPQRAEREVYLVVCEGETEKRYFETMRSYRGLNLHAIHPKQAKHPQRQTVIEAARQAVARDADAYTEVWAVFDTDGQDCTALIRQAQNDGLRCAPSTPTFETWLILHLRDHRAAIVSGTKGEKLLQSLLPRWSKGKGTRFDDFAQGLEDACARAESLRPGSDPSTDMHQLIRAVSRN